VNSLARDILCALVVAVDADSDFLRWEGNFVSLALIIGHVVTCQGPAPFCPLLVRASSASRFVYPWL
jgi:hypothetical protein